MTSLGEGIRGVAQHLAARAGIVEYVTIASTVSLVVGGIVLPKLINRGAPQPAPQCPPCACLCASTCVPAPTH